MGAAVGASSLEPALPALVPKKVVEKLGHLVGGEACEMECLLMVDVIVGEARGEVDDDGEGESFQTSMPS